MVLLQCRSEPFGDHGRKLSNRHKELFRGIVPGHRVISHTATGHHHMHMRMMMQLTGPGMQDRQDADLGTDVALLASQIAYGIGSDLHEQTIERLLMSQKQGA